MIHLHIPELMPDEFILGYLGRIGAVNGIRSEPYMRTVLRQSYKQQNGQDSEGTLIEHLAKVSGIDTYHFARHHTLIPLYRAVASHLHKHLHGEPGDFGLLSAHSPRLMRNDLQLCPECIREDVDYLGFTFWRRSHQLPGVDWCPKHSTPLHSIAGNQSDLLKPPHVVLERLGWDARQVDKTIEENPVVGRYAELVQVVLDFKSPIAPEAISPLLAEKARQHGLRTAPNGNKPVLSDIISKQLPSAWKKTHFPSLQHKKPNEFLYEYDGVCKPGGKAHSSSCYILAIAILCHSVQEGQKLLLDAFQAAPNNRKANSPVQPISIRRMKSAYVASNGNIKHMANLMQSNYRSLLVATKSKGFPILTDTSIETLQALQDFYDQKATLHEILMRPGIQVAKISEILRTAATPHAKLLSDIVHNHRMHMQQPITSLST